MTESNLLHAARAVVLDDTDSAPSCGRAERFASRGLLADEELAAENVMGFAWWPLSDVLSYDGPDLFSPRRLGVHLSELLREGPPPEPRELGTHD